MISTPPSSVDSDGAATQSRVDYFTRFAVPGILRATGHPAPADVLSSMISFPRSREGAAWRSAAQPLTRHIATLQRELLHEHAALRGRDEVRVLTRHGSDAKFLAMSYPRIDGDTRLVELTLRGRGDLGPALAKITRIGVVLATLASIRQGNGAFPDVMREIETHLEHLHQPARVVRTPTASVESLVRSYRAARERELSNSSSTPDPGRSR